MATETADRADRVPGRLPAGALAALCLAELVCLGALMGPVFGGISFRTGTLTQFGSDWERAKAIVLCTGAAAALVANVGFGVLTDALVRRGHHRAWWIAAGPLAGLPCLYLAAEAASLTGLVAGWVGAQVAYNASFAALYALLSDLTRPEERSRAGGWFAGSATGSLIIGAAMLAWYVPRRPPFPADAEELLFLPLAVLAVPVTLLAALHLSRLPTRPSSPERGPERAGAAFWWLAGQRALAQLAFGFVTAFGVESLVRRVGLAPGEAIATFALTTAISAGLCVLVAVFVARPLVRRTGPRPVMVAGALSLIVACSILMVATSVAAFAGALLIAGAGTGAFFATDLAAALAVVPESARGRYLGLFNIARTLPQTLVPMATPPLLALGGDRFGVSREHNYLLFFAVGTIVALLSLVTIKPLTLPDKDGLVGA